MVARLSIDEAGSACGAAVWEKPWLSIVMPTLNEARNLPSTLVALQPFLRRGAELVVADGGSTDATAQLARGAGAVVVATSRGRAVQMNAGAAVARGDVLLFLHADTLLPPEADVSVRQALQPLPVMTSGSSTGWRGTWGRFDVRIAGQARMLQVIGGCMNRRSRWTGIATGDQAMFMTRAAFDAVGGFPAQPLMEDIEMSSRLLRLARPVCLRDRVTTSGRRWEQRGVWRTMALMWRLRLAYWLGASPEWLARQYR